MIRGDRAVDGAAPIPGSEKYQDPTHRNLYKTHYDHAQQELIPALRAVYERGELKVPDSVKTIMSVISQSYAASYVNKWVAEQDASRQRRNEEELRELEALDKRITEPERAAVKTMASVLIDTAEEIIASKGWLREPENGNLAERVLRNPDLERSRQTGLLSERGSHPSRGIPPFRLYFGKLSDLMDDEERRDRFETEYGHLRPATTELLQSIHAFTFEFADAAGFKTGTFLDKPQNYEAVKDQLPLDVVHERFGHLMATGIMDKIVPRDWVSFHPTLPYVAYSEAGIVSTPDYKKYQVNQGLVLFHHDPSAKR